MPDSPLDVRRDGHLLILRLNRPEQLNALNSAAIELLTAAVKQARGDAGVRCIVITGAPRPDGRPCFSAGVDLKEAADGHHPPGDPGGALCNLLDDMSIPSIAVIDGVCTTGAVELALACDLRIVAETAQISEWHLKRLGSGLGGWGLSTRLPRLVGVAQAKDLMLTGKVIDGAEALRIGFAQRLTSSAELWPEAMAAAAAICGMRPEGVRMTMAHLSRVADLSKEESLSFARQLRELFDRRESFADSARAAVRDLG
jgi:enoyl-CoA hydratase/carnithine racemase